MSKQEQRGTSASVQDAIGSLNSAMIRLLVGNDWFGDAQTRRTILDEFNHAIRTLSRQGWLVYTKPFSVVMERLEPSEPMAVAVRSELEAMKAVFDEHFRPVGSNRQKSGDVCERMGSESTHGPDGERAV